MNAFSGEKYQSLLLNRYSLGTFWKALVSCFPLLKRLPKERVGSTRRWASPFCKARLAGPTYLSWELQSPSSPALCLLCSPVDLNRPLSPSSPTTGASGGSPFPSSCHPHLPASQGPEGGPPPSRSPQPPARENLREAPPLLCLWAAPSKGAIARSKSLK